MAEDSKARLLRYLNDALAAEEGGMSSLKEFAAESTAPAVLAAARKHLAATQLQADRLAQRIQSLGGDKQDGKSRLNSLIGKSSDFLNIFHDQDDKQTQDLIKAYALSGFEDGMYLSLKSYAEAIGDPETAQLAGALSQEEQAIGATYLQLIPQTAAAAIGLAAPEEVLTTPV
jgi:ferritin-like metal-binding protein YciE